MHTKTKNNITHVVTNTFGVLGYLACAVQWLWVVIVYSHSLQSYLTSVTPQVEKPVIHQSTIQFDGNASVLFLILGAVVTILIFVTSIYFVIKTPKVIVKTASKVVHDVAETVTPAVLHATHKQDTPRNKKQVAISVRVIIKFIFVIAPFIVALTSIQANTHVFDAGITLTVSALLLAASLFFFATQYVLGAVLGSNKQDI